MPTYLLAFVITDYPYQKTEQVAENGIILRTFSKPVANKTGQIDYLQLTSDAIGFFSVMLSISQSLFWVEIS